MKFRLPFRKKQDDSDEIGPDTGLDEDFDYLEPSALQKKLPWIAVVIGYLLFFSTLAGVAAYLMLNEETIQQELRAERPQLTVKRLQLQVSALPGAGASANENAFFDTASALSATAARSNAGKAGVNASDAGASDSAIGADEAASLQANFDTTAPDGLVIPDAESNMLQTHPAPGLIEETAVGPMPRIGDDGRQPWQVYARPVNRLETRPKIAVVITNLGLSDKSTEQAIALPGSMSLAFAPYAQKLAAWISRSRAAGHEVLVTLPMEPANFPKSDPGPFALLSTLDTAQNIRRLEWIMTRSTGYIGLVNFMGAGFSTNEKIIRPVFTLMRERGIAYLDTREISLDTAGKIARTIGVPTASADMLIDGNVSRSGIAANLARLETLAKEKGMAIAIARPYPVTLSRLKDWSRDTEARGLVLVPVSSVIAASRSAAG